MKITIDFSDTFYSNEYKHDLITKIVFLVLCLPFLFLLYDSIAYFFEHVSSLTILNLLKRLWFIFVPVCFIYFLITRFIGYKISLLANRSKIESLFGVKYIEHSCISSYSYYFNSTGNGVLLTIFDESKN